MRLTLRTMLAYLDDVLEPGDAEQLGTKIQESEFASGLVHRIRNSMRRLRLGAPKLDGKGMGLDANTVAEYLDSAMSSNRVPDFEKVCLESDVHIAEVASCHQILTMVLGEPANVDPAVRDRIYKIGLTPDPPVSTEEGVPSAPVDPVAEKPVPSVDAEVKAEHGTKPRVPDYLRAGSRRRFWPFAATAALAFLAAAVILLLMGPMDSRHPLARLMGKGEPNKIIDFLPSDPDASPLTGNIHSGESDITPLPEQAKPVAPKLTVVDPENVPLLPPGKNPTESGLRTLPKNVPPVEPIPTIPSPKKLKVESSIKPVQPLKPVPNSEPKLPVPTEEPKSEKTTIPEKVYMGRYISDFQVLTRFDGTEETWLRVPTNAPISAGTPLLALPTYRPQIALSAGIQLTISGPSEVQLLSPNEKGVPQLLVSYGRSLLVTDGKVGTRIALRLGSRDGEVMFSSPDSALAIEVEKYLPPGVDPESSSALSVVRLFAVGGSIQWQEGDEVVSIVAGQARTLLGKNPGTTASIEQFPDWITSRAISDIDRRASQELETKLDFERPLVLSLTERCGIDQERHIEVRSLAIRCLSYLNNHEPFVDALNLDSNRAFWEAQINEARQALARSPQAAAEVRISFEKLRGGDAVGLYRMLWGYSPQQLKGTSAQELVSALDHKSMDFRVLAWVNLKQITGMTLLYRPETTASRRRSSTQKWREKLGKGKIAYKVAPVVPGASKKPPKSSE